MSEKKFKVGDRVRVKGRTCISTIMYMKDGWVSVDTPIKTAEAYPEDGVEYVDPRTAFLQELKELLTKYNVTIDGGCLGWDNEDPFVSFDSKDFKLTYCDEYLGKFKFPLTPENIMDYDKK